MDDVVLSGSGIRSSRFGFGCAKLFRIATSRDRQRVLETAYETGIRHFDVARMYGLGCAERELGRFARSRRDQVVLATKFGIEPRRWATMASFIQGIGRRLIRQVPSLRGRIAGAARSLHRTNDFSAKGAERSLELSLRELRTDYIDLFLLHEPRMEDVLPSDLFDFLERARTCGKIRAYGLAGDLHEIESITANLKGQSPICRSQVWQFGSDVLNRHIDSVSRSDARCLISFSPISAALPPLQAAFRKSIDERGRHLRQYNLDLADPAILAGLLLWYSYHRNPGGVTLFSASDPERLRRLVASRYDVEQVAAFAGTVQDVVQS